MNEGIRLYRQGKFKEAMDHFLALKLPWEEQALQSYYLGLCYTHLGKNDEALLYLEQVVNSDLGFAQIYQARMIMAYIYAVTERYRLAEFELNRLIEDGYESAKGYAALGFVQYSQGKTAAAISNLEQALRMDPGNPNAMNSLGYILADQNIHPEKALQYCKRAHALRPENPVYMDSLALALVRNQRPQEAEKMYRLALERAPGNAQIGAHLQELLQTRGGTL
jgi:tetratricopeptide (TPR) repeat protein